MITLIIGMNAVFVMRSKMKADTLLSKKAVRASTGKNAMFVIRSKMKANTLLNKKAMRTNTGKNVQHVNKNKTEMIILFPRNGAAMALITGMNAQIVEQSEIKKDTSLNGNTIMTSIGKYAAYVKK